VRCLVRDPSRLQGRDWLPHVEVATGDVLRPAGLADALAGVDVAYCLVYSMADGKGFHERDVAAARSFARAAADAGVSRIVYLGGLGDPEAGISDHLRSRQDTGDALREAGVPVTEFRAAVVVGSGSISFEMIRYLTERLPVMICPKSMYTKVQPIGVDDVLRYLVDTLDVPESAGRVIEVGGADVRTHGDLMLGYAQARGGRGAGAAAAAPRRDESARPRLATVRDAGAGRRHVARADDLLRAQGAARPSLLVLPVLCPWRDILGYDCGAGRRGQSAGSASGGRRTLQSVTGRHPAEALRATSATCA